MLWVLIITLQTVAAAQTDPGGSSSSSRKPVVSSTNSGYVLEFPLTLAAYQAWFGLDSHIKPPPYISTDTTVISDHITAAMAQGIDGFVVDWYGPEAGVSNDVERKFIDEATAELVQQSGERGFYVALMYDEGTVSAAETLTTAYTTRVISDLLYARQYFSMPGYLHISERPALFVFAYDTVDPYVDWAKVRYQLGVTITLFDKDPNPLDLEHDAQFDGFYAWVQPTAGEWLTDGTEWGEGYLTWFYNTMATPTYTDKVTIGGVWPGFDDSLALWGSGRYMWRRCGQTWRDTWGLAGEYNPPIVMIDTWNDLEEDTDIEYGIGECLIPSRQELALPGRQVVYTHTVANTAKFTDTFYITAHSSSAWPTVMDPISTTLVGHASTTLLVSLTIPEAANRGTRDRLVVTATSGLGTAVHSSVVDTTTVAYPIHLPLVMRNALIATITGEYLLVGNPCTTDPCLPGLVYAVLADDTYYYPTVEGSWLWWNRSWDGYTPEVGDFVTVIGYVDEMVDIFGTPFYNIIEVVSLKPASSPPATMWNIVVVDVRSYGAGDQEPDEYVEIRNDDTQPVQLNGWTLRNSGSHVFTFPNHLMQPGQVCRVYTNEDHPEWCGFSYGSESAIWNYADGCAYLWDSVGTLIDPYCYCQWHTAYMTISATATTLEVGEVVTVTATLFNRGCVGLGLPQYRLYVRSDESQPIFDPNNPEPVVHYLGVAPGQSDAEEFVLQAVGSGQATLNASASFEVHLGYPGPAYWGAGSTGPLVITVMP